MKLLIHILFMCCFTAQAVKAQNITGLWNGGLTSDTTGVPIINTYYTLDIKEQNNGVVYGKAYVYEKRYKFDGALDFTGVFKGNELKIKEFNIIYSLIPTDVHRFCLKDLVLYYSAENGKEYLKGKWKGKLEDGNRCIPGAANLQRTTPQQLSTAVPTAILQNLLVNSGPVKFQNTTFHNPLVIDVRSPVVQMQITDYLREDDDTISVYYNRSNFLRRQRISKIPLIKTLRLDRSTEVHELILFADNIGKVPPNTCVLTVDDGYTKQNLIIQSTLQSSAVVHLRYVPPE